MLLGPQGNRRVDGGGAAGGHKTGEQCRDQEYGGDHNEGERIRRTYIEE